MEWKADYQKCSWYVRDVLGVRLFPYQEQILKAFCDGLTVRTARGIGRSFVAKCYGKYIAHDFYTNRKCVRPASADTEESFAAFVASQYDRNNYFEDPDVIFPYTCALKCGVLNQWNIDFAKSVLSEKQFNAEMLCIWKDM